MSKVKREPVEEMGDSGSSAFEIREEIVRWDSVKTAHDLYDDMEVARMLLDCYDLIGGHFLVWSDEAKLAPPPLYATLRLQHISEEGWQILQEIKALGAWVGVKDPKRGSRRKQGKVRRIRQVEDEEEEVEVEFDMYGLSEEDCHDSQDEDYNPALEEEDFDPEMEVKTSRRKRRGFQRVTRQIKKEEDMARSHRKSSPDKAEDSEEEAYAESDEDEYAPSKTPKRKRGRPKKGEVRTKAVKAIKKKGAKKKEAKKNEAKKKEKPVKKNWGRYAKSIKVYQCTLCTTIVESPDEFKEHYKTHIDTKQTPEEETKNAEEGKAIKPRKVDLDRDATTLFRCLSCNEVMKSKDEHRKLHDRNRRPMVCHLCGKILNSVETYRKHLQMHDAKTSGVQIMCKICGKSFPIAASLKSHMRSHSRARPHICDSCGKAFKSQYHLDRHLLIHIPVKPMTCSYCGKGFNNESNLKGHIRIHTGEKPYKCDLCPMAFTHNVSLKSHKKSVHGIDMWKVQARGASLECDDLFQRSAATAAFPKRKEGKAAVEEEEAKNSVAKKLSSDLDELSIQQALHSISADIPGGLSASQNPVAMESNEDVPTASSTHQESDNAIIRPVIPEERGHKSDAIASSHPSFGLSRSEQPHVQIQPYPSIPPSQAAAASEYINLPLRRGPPFNMPDIGISQSAQDYWEAAKRTFTKL